MNATETRPALQPLLSAHVRFAAAVGIALVLASAWVKAGQASHEAVQTATQAITYQPVYVTLPSVEIVGRRERVAGTNPGAV